jgi:hypothetical protein
MSNVCDVWDECSELLECNFFSIWIVILDTLGVGRSQWKLHECFLKGSGNIDAG